MEIVRRIADRWGGDRSSVRILAHENNLVQLRAGDADLILRLSWDGDRKLEDFVAQLDFLVYLATHGAHVSLPVLSGAGNWVEVLELGEGKVLYAVVFVKLPGVRPSFAPTAAWDGEFLEKIGRTLGKLHALSQRYGTPAEARRFGFADRDLPSLLASTLPSEESLYLERLRSFWSWMRSLPRDPRGYGLVHGDFHPPNLLLSEGEVYVLNFDNCCYCWFASDIAQFLSMALLPLTDQELAIQEERARFLFSYFMRGYLQEKALARKWIEKLGQFMLGFDLILYYSLITKMKAVGINLPYYAPVRAGVLAGKPRVDLDFARLYDEVREEIADLLAPEPERGRVCSTGC